jgi:hypothetical protein
MKETRLYLGLLLIVSLTLFACKKNRDFENGFIQYNSYKCNAFNSYISAGYFTNDRNERVLFTAIRADYILPNELNPDGVKSTLVISFIDSVYPMSPKQFIFDSAYSTVKNFTINSIGKCRVENYINNAGDSTIESSWFSDTICNQGVIFKFEGNANRRRMIVSGIKLWKEFYPDINKTANLSFDFTNTVY